MFSLRYRDALPSAVLDELESLINQLKGFLGISFNEDGTLIGSNPLLNVVPVGSVQAWLTGTAPSGWLILDGSQKNRVTYKSLFELWGTTYGAGDGSTTFTLPDMRGRFMLGKAAAGTGAVLGETGGAIDHTHSLSGLSLSGATAATTPAVSGSTANATATISGTTGAEASHTHGVNIDSASETLEGIPTVSPYAAAGTAQFAHHHNVNGNTGAGSSHSHSAGTLAADNHSHGTGSLAVASHTHAVGTLAVSGGTMGAANPPYFAGNWIVFAGV